MFRAIKNEGVLFLILLVVIVLFFSFLLYNINSTNQYVRSILQHNYYQGAGLDEYLTERIDNELSNIIEEKIANNELSAIISFNKSASRIDLFVNVLGVVSVIIFLSIGILIWASTKDRNESRNTLKETRKIFDEMKEMRKRARRYLIEQVGYKDTADRFDRIRRLGSRMRRNLIKEKNK